MKHKYLTLALFAFFILFIYMPDFSTPIHQKSSNWSFTMERVVVSGSNLGIYHPLDEGVLTISGSVWSFSQDPACTIKPEPIIIEIYERKDWWIDRRVGTIKLTPSGNLNERVYFEESFGPQPASNKYYFHITKYNGKDDGWNLKGSGTININN